MTDWISFATALPSFPRQIVIMNYYRPSKHTNTEARYFTCRSTDYQRILGENNMDMTSTYWITLPLLPMKDLE
jgi:hypothetical protein